MLGKASVIVVIGFGIILGYISLNLNRMATNSVGNMSSYLEANVSHGIALAGANVGLAKFYGDTTWFGSMTQNLSTAFQGSFTANMTDLGGNIARLRSVSTYTVPPPNAQTLHDTVEVFFNKSRLNSFSMFAWMTQNENGVNWITGDTVWGRVHSNGTLTVNGKPVFMEKMTTSKNFNKKPGKNPNYAIFKQGYETGVAAIKFPNDLSSLITASENGGKKYNGNIWVTLSPGTGADNDGVAFVGRSPNDASPDTVHLNNPGFNGALVATGTVHTQGTVDGQLTIGAGSNIVIENNVLYEQNPQDTPSNDLLGLCAENDVVVADNSSNNSNCEIDACVFSRTGSFMAEDYDSRPVSGELRLLGSIVQDVRGPVGTFSGNRIQSGFSKRYRYDSRLKNPATRPPYYPGFFVKTYAIANWWESFRVPDIR
ncbi:MAG: hypothetical protein ABI623_04610 [bacterium]